MLASTPGHLPGGFSPFFPFLSLLSLGLITQEAAWGSLKSGPGPGVLPLDQEGFRETVMKRGSSCLSHGEDCREGRHERGTEVSRLSLGWRDSCSAGF